MKKFYENPIASLEIFKQIDIITTSPANFDEGIEDDQNPFIW